MFNILVASKMSLFKCRDLLEVAMGAEVPHPTNTMTNFNLAKATEEITKIIGLQSRGKKINLSVRYASRALKSTTFLGDSTKY